MKLREILEIINFRDVVVDSGETTYDTKIVRISFIDPEYSSYQDKLFIEFGRYDFGEEEISRRLDGLLKKELLDAEVASVFVNDNDCLEIIVEYKVM